MQTVVPAAGRGSRLESLTAATPKGLVSIAGQPLLEYVFERAVEAGTEELVVVIGYEGQQIIDHFGDTYDGIPITYVRQQDRRGLAHAVLQAESCVEGPFLLLNGDNVFSGPVTPAVSARAAEGVDGVLATETVSKARAARTGVVEFENGDVVAIHEKPSEPPSRTVTTGCYVLPEAIFDACKLVQPSAEREYQLSEAVGLLIAAGYTIETVSLCDRVNVNRPADIERAEAMLE